MTGGPLVSVVIPAWNSERTLLQTLQSVAAQTHRNLEILIIDDGSTDSTSSLASDFCSSEPRARLIQTKNRGVSCARNRGIAEAQADYIAPIDADDIWHPTKIEKQLRPAIAAPAPVGFVYCWYRQIDEECRLLSSGPRVELKGQAFSQLAYVNPVENGSAPLFSRSALLSVGGYDEDLPPYEDVVVQLRIAAKYPIDLVPEHLVGWRLHGSNASNDIDLIVSQARRMYARLVAEGLPVPRRALRWAAARNAFDIAEKRATGGRPASAAIWLARALGGDPALTGLKLVYRIARMAKRAIAGQARPQKRPRFTEIDPAAQIQTDMFAIPRITALIEGVDRNRLNALKISQRGELAPKLGAAAIADAHPRQSEQV